MQAIRRIHLSDKQSRSGKWFWALSTNGEFSIQSLYKSMTREQPQHPDPVSACTWKKLWKTSMVEGDQQ
ncbi:hypothetical protein PanWU01x14_235780 [Parasponia andersonii]|uniref:Uncharacterized protein n=1 Tax=Parasponia andersonii TaxID=3476 RepID=A0A2P5BIS7_PARAD|nr:hypothetical protein PanWU01x14_235780 [Parasponia andersonii]